MRVAAAAAATAAAAMAVVVALAGGALACVFVLCSYESDVEWRRGCLELVLLQRHDTEYRHQSVALHVRMSVQTVNGDGDGEGDGVDGNLGDRNEE